MNNLTFNYVCDLVLEKNKELEGTVEEREENFLNLLKDKPSLYTAYERTVEILKHETDGLTINDLYRDAVRADEETGKRAIQLTQFKKLIDVAAKKVGNIEFNIYSGTYTLHGPDLDELRDGDIPNIEDMDDLDKDADEEGSDELRRDNLEDDENIRDALKDYKSSSKLEDY